MAGAKYKDLIIETIDQLRKRKTRADLERICVMLMRKHGLSFEDIVLDLEKLVEDNIVLKVDYRGNVSYRNATSRKKYTSSDTKENLKRVFEAFNKISTEENENGQQDPHVTVELIEGWLLEHDTEIERDAISVAIQKLIDDGTVQEEEDEGVYILSGHVQLKNKKVVSKTVFSNVKLKSPKDKMDSKTKQKTGPKGKKTQPTQRAYQEEPKTTNILPGDRSDNKTPSPGKKGRAPTKRKRIKKTHGPDFETYFVPCKTSKRRDSGYEKKEEKTLVKLSPASSRSSPDATCDFCLKTAESNKNGRPEDLLFCKDCRAKAHPSCMDYSEDLARRARNSPWQCIDCKTCYICEDSGDADAMLFCDACDKGYHMDCHDPPITEKPTGKWVCTRCIEQDERESETKSSTSVPNGSVNGDSNSTILPTPRESPVPVNDFKPSQVVQSMPSLPSQPCSHSTLLQILPSFKKYSYKDVPDASLWSIKEVVDFFKDAGFGDQASVFQEQEIDGKSLLLMKRSDVLQGLSLKLGPALKIYAHIQRLQTKGQLVI